MPGNPNMQKLGKRRNPPASQQPDWLFPSSNTSSPAPKPQVNDRKKNEDQKLADDLLKRRAAGEPAKISPPTQLLELIGAYLSENDYTGTSQALRKERTKRGEREEKVDGVPSLSTIFNEWCDLKGMKKESAVIEKKAGKSAKQEVKAKTDSSSDSESSDGDSDVEMVDPQEIKKSSKKAPSVSPSSASSSSSSDSDADDEKDVPPQKTTSPKPKANGLKRKAASSSSSSSDSDSDSSSDSDAPKSKKVKTVAVSDSSSDSSSTSSSDSSSEDETPKAKVTKGAVQSSSESDSSSSESDSESSSEDDAKSAKTKPADSSSDSDSSSSESDDSDSSIDSVAKNIPLPASDKESDSESEPEHTSKTTKKVKKARKIVNASDTSATLSDAPKKMSPSSSDSSSDSSSSPSDSETEAKPAAVIETVTTTIRKLSPPLPPDPVLKLKKKAYEPFSRIPKDTKVDERLASNAYVPYDYAQRAHEDLIVTKGKGFTKEKNKKKRGSYRGGYIDVEGKKGIKFED